MSSFGVAQTLDPGSVPSSEKDKILSKVRFEQKLNAQLPLKTEFRDETGKLRPLGSWFRGKPVMMMLIAYRCTMLCNQELKVLISSLRQMDFRPGRQFDLLIVSIDAREDAAMARLKEKSTLADYGRPETADGWHFLTGSRESIEAVTKAIGFHFTYDPKTDQFAHPDGVTILTPGGVASSYYFSLNYPPRDLRYGLIQAADNRIGSMLDYIALTCFHYDPKTGAFSLRVLSLVRLVSLLFVLVGVVWVVASHRGDRNRAIEAAPGADLPAAPSSLQ